MTIDLQISFGARPEKVKYNTGACTNCSINIYYTREQSTKQKQRTQRTIYLTHGCVSNIVRYFVIYMTTVPLKKKVKCSCIFIG